MTPALTDTPDTGATISALKDTSDTLFRFSFDGLPIRGQWVRLENILTEAFRYRTYPQPIADLVAAQLAAVAMLADNLKFQGAVALQSKGSGALIRSLAECREQHKLRGIAHLNEDKPAPADQDLVAWLGAGQLALTLIDTASGHTFSQAMIELVETDLASNLENYFTQSEQLPTRLFFATTGTSVTALLLQRLPAPQQATEIALEEHQRAWETAASLTETLRGDPQGELASLEPVELLRRLFGEFETRLHPPRQLTFGCTCSRSKSDRTLLTLGADDLDEILDELGHVQVDCEFCGNRYSYSTSDIEALKRGQYSEEPPPLH